MKPRARLTSRVRRFASAAKQSRLHAVVSRPVVMDDEYLR
jgi:Tfp pilus assembly protein FimT